MLALGSILVGSLVANLRGGAHATRGDARAVVERLRPDFQLPAPVDADTRLETLEADDGKVVFGFTVANRSADALAAAVAHDGPRIAGAVCPGLAAIFAQGVSVELRYRAAGAAGYAPLLIRPARCI
jgi:hypothetical protein